MGVRIKPEVDLVLQRLNEGRLDAFVNSFEWSKFECKGSPYQFEHLDQKFEFAKDVSALANVDGGVILIGATTELTENGQTEIVTQIRTFPESLVDTAQMRDILREWLYPPLRDLTIRWYPSANEPDKGVVAIHVPKASEELRPIIVSKVLKETGKIRGNIFGLFERWQDEIAFWGAQKLHELIRSGQNAHVILQRLDVLQASVDSQPATSESTPTSRVADIAKTGVEESATGQGLGEFEDVGLAAMPAYILRGTPMGAVSLPEFFASQESPFRKLVQDPPKLRYGGFGIYGGGSAQIYRGKAWRSMHSDAHRLLEIRSNGQVVFAAPADASFLCWGRHQPEGGRRLNPVALIESVYLFAELLRQLQVLAGPKNVGYLISIGLERVREPGKTVFLGPGRIGAFGWGSFELNEAPENSIELRETWVQEEIRPAELAYNCLVKLYQWFEFTHDNMPFVRDEAGKRVVDIEAIKSLAG